jgi:putative redox protein
MDMTIEFPGGSKVETHFGPFTVQTDQPPAASASTPFDVFLSPIGTCAGIYVLGFCRESNLPTAGLKIHERILRSPTSRMVERVSLEIQLPAGFYDKYREAVIRSAELCAVKRHLEHPPAFDITTSLN